MNKFTFLMAASALSAVSMAQVLNSTSFESNPWPTANSTFSSAPAATGWSAGSGWGVRNDFAVSGTQSLWYEARQGATAPIAPNSTIQGPNVTTALTSGPTLVSVSHMIRSTATTGAAVGANGATGIVVRTNKSFGTNVRFGIQNNGQVVRQEGFGSFTVLGTISGFQDRWLTTSLALNTSTNSYVYSILDGATTVGSFSGNLINAGIGGTEQGLQWAGLWGSSNGGSGAAVFATAYFDSFSVEAVPEPATLSVLAVAGILAARRRRR